MKGLDSLFGWKTTQNEISSSCGSSCSTKISNGSSACGGTAPGEPASACGASSPADLPSSCRGPVKEEPKD